MNLKTYQELVCTIEKQKILIERHMEMITHLIKENAEKENFIRELTKEVSDRET